MNKQPVIYMQTDPRWKNADYSAPGESTTIGRAGCGPTCAAMLATTLTGRTITPVDACKWSLDHGYKAKGQGTYYAFFRPFFAAYGIEADQLSWTNTYGKPDSGTHKTAFAMLKEGYYLIACMGKGLWTSSGHFVVVWWEDGKVRINDPASTKTSRLNGDPETFRSQAKYYFWVDARKYNKEDDDDMSYETFVEYMDRYLSELAGKDASSWAKAGVSAAVAAGISDGSRPQDFLTRQEGMIMCNNAATLMKNQK